MLSKLNLLFPIYLLWQGEHHKFVMTFHAASNFPIDIYFLFDSSMTMEAYLKEFANLADDIGESHLSLAAALI